MAHVNASDLKGKSFLKIFGNTYANQDAIKALGDTYWSKTERCWVVRIAHLSQTAKAAVAAKSFPLTKAGCRLEVE